MTLKLKTIFVPGFIFLVFLFTPLFTRAAEIDFNIDPSYDYIGRNKVTAFLQQIGVNAYFYVESEYYQNLDDNGKKEFAEQTRNLSSEFDENIYPRLRELFGEEWKPGIDKDPMITILLARIKGDSGGYFNSGDEYPKIQVQDSNEREMIYLNVNQIKSPLIKGFLAHEFTHLITFNQKDKLRGVSEEIWLNEARAEAAISFLGYDKEYQGSNLQRRVKAFLSKTTDPLTEWKNESPDYSSINLFFQYILDHYGFGSLANSMKTEKIGIASLNEALKKQGFSEDFAQIFTDWTIAVLANDCALGSKYCYLNENLKNLKIVPQLNYIPQAQESTLTLVNYAKNWQGNWYKFVGSQGTLKLEFIGDQKVKFRAPYLLEDSFGKYTVSFLELNSSQRSTNYFQDFGKKIKSLALVPLVQSKTEGFGEIEPFYQFIVTASVIADNSERKEEADRIQEDLVKSLLSQIDSLQKEIARLQSQIAAASGNQSAKNNTQNNSSVACAKFENDLYFGIRNNTEVTCLQEFLAFQDSVYPEKIVSGNFLSLTQKAVTRFQEKYASEILIPLGLKKGTGYVGERTRNKINQILQRLSTAASL